MCVMQVPMMDIAGRRPLLLFPMLAMILDLALMTVCQILQVSPLTLHSQPQQLFSTLFSPTNDRQLTLFASLKD